MTLNSEFKRELILSTLFIKLSKHNQGRNCHSVKSSQLLGYNVWGKCVSSILWQQTRIQYIFRIKSYSPLILTVWDTTWLLVSCDENREVRNSEGSGQLFGGCPCFYMKFPITEAVYFLWFVSNLLLNGILIFHSTLLYNNI